MPISGRKTFTELFETLQNELVREAASGEESKYKGIVNQVYLNELPAMLPETYLKKDAFVLTAADYTTGTVTVGTGTTNMIGSSTSWTAANSSNFLIDVSGYNQTYRMTFSTGTSLTFQDSLAWTEASGSGLGYTLFQNRYVLPTDFSYMVKDSPDSPNVVYRYLNNVKIFLTPWTNEEYDRQFTSNIGTIFAYTVKWVSGSAYLYVASNPDDADNVGYSYIPVLTQLRELTSGTATLTTGTSLVLTSAADMTVSLDTSRVLYARNDADGTGSASQWFKISTVANATVATLSSSFRGTSGTGITYTISEISQWPERFDNIILYKSAWIVDVDKNQVAKWSTLLNDSLSASLTTESKRKRGWTLKNFPGMRQ